jgi:hypothetical protein
MIRSHIQKSKPGTHVPRSTGRMKPANWSGGWMSATSSLRQESRSGRMKSWLHLGIHSAIAIIHDTKQYGLSRGSKPPCEGGDQRKLTTIFQLEGGASRPFFMPIVSRPGDRSDFALQRHRKHSEPWRCNPTCEGAHDWQ